MALKTIPYCNLMMKISLNCAFNFFCGFRAHPWSFIQRRLIMTVFGAYKASTIILGRVRKRYLCELKCFAYFKWGGIKKNKRRTGKSTIFVEILEATNMGKDRGLLSTKHTFVKKKNTFLTLHKTRAPTAKFYAPSNERDLFILKGNKKGRTTTRLARWGGWDLVKAGHFRGPWRVRKTRALFLAFFLIDFPFWPSPCLPRPA